MLMDFPTVVLLLLSILGTCFLILASNSRARKSHRLPPGPFPFPIIGNILSLGYLPHRSLAKLSLKYGTLMTLQLGTQTTVVVSSQAMAKALFQKHDLSISSKTIRASIEAIGHGKESIAWIPIGAKWRKLRKICKEQIFSVKKLDASRGVRTDKVQELCDHIKECGKVGHAVNIGEVAFTTLLNLISVTLFSKDLASFNSSNAQETKEMVWGVMKCIAKPNIVDYFPSLKCVDPQGISREMKFYVDKLISIFDGIIEEKLNSGCSKGDLTDILLDVNLENAEELSRKEINHLLLDLFVAGIDTTSSMVEWAFTELFRNPDKMSKLKDEIREIIGDNNEIQEKDIARLPYLRAVVKETLRIHPPGPLLMPHKAESNIEVKGYVIPKNTQILINIWAIGRNADAWIDAESFIPERFLQNHNEIEYNGRNFELIPFGSGRRICPGLPLADRMMHVIIGSLIHKFGWKLENDMEPRGIDMSEKFGLVLHKVEPLKAIPVLRF